MRWVWTGRACIFILRLCHTTSTLASTISTPAIIIPATITPNAVTAAAVTGITDRDFDSIHSCTCIHGSPDPACSIRM